MTERKIYTCDICGHEYSNKEEALHCEKRHVPVASVDETKYTYIPHQKYPKMVKITFADGAEKRYEEW